MTATGSGEIYGYRRVSPFWPVVGGSPEPELIYRTAHDPWMNPVVILDISPDPLGPVNKILSLRAYDVDTYWRIGKSVLYPIRKGAKISLTQMSTYEAALWGWPPWIVTVDGREVLRVPYHEALPPSWPKPSPPRRQRVRTALNSRVRRAANRFAGWFGYIHEDDVDHEDCI